MLNHSYTYKSKRTSFTAKVFKKTYKLLFIISLSFLLFYLSHSYLGQGKEQVVALESKVSSAMAETKESKVVEVQPVAKKTASMTKQDLLDKLEADLAPNSQFAVSIYDLNRTEEFGIDETTSFHAASVMKLLIAVAALQRVEEGKNTLGQKLGTYTFQWQLQQMVNKSNNDSWGYFNNLIGFSGEQKFADQLGIVGIKIVGNQMTTASVSQLLLKIYNGGVLKDENRNLLLSYMQKTNVENRITAGIPAGIAVYHKEGSLESRIHDAAIVLHPRNPFIIVIFTKGTDPGVATSARIKSFQKAASDTYTYFDLL